MDADRMDYLLRDSYHAGVQYGRFDLRRLRGTIRAIPGTRDRAARLGISQGGAHAAEGLVLARYFMFTQVYFHKTRVAYDLHLRGALKELLPGGRFPSPAGDQIDGFLRWDDWRVLGLLAHGKGGEHGDRLARRNHYRRIYATPETCTENDLQVLDRVKEKLGPILQAEESAGKSWYKTGKPDIPVVSSLNERDVLPLSHHSTMIANLRANNQVLLYAKPQDVEQASTLIGEVTKL